MQTVYLKVWDRAGRFDASRASPITWLGTIARNAAIDWRRTAGARLLGGEPLDGGPAREIADDAPRADALMLIAESDARLHHCLGELEGRTQLCIRAAFFDGLTYADLAEREAVPLGTMKSWIRRGLLRLKDCLGDG